ncbi:MAG TPA: endolytic transglycosylase MltG [Candidatus Aquilonibacter sp.]|nr:endolytic transglycosylase MltG [Candidatus Aquilonibacter sp.]
MKRLGLLALLLIAALGAGAGWLDSQISRPYRGHRPENVFVDIPRGASRWKIAGILRQDDVIRNRLAFTLFSVWHFRRPVLAGEYYIDQPLNSREVFWKMARGQVYVRALLVPEGWTSFEIADEIQQEGICSREDFLAAARDRSLVSNLAPGAQSLEGFLFPSTYEFTRHHSCEQIAKHMVQNFKAVWDAIGPDPKALPDGLTPLQVVTMASLVERETPDAEERPLVAGVFYNRLRKRVPLQCDPTVQYALALEGHRIKDVKPKDLLVDSPYNTYTHVGLPPGPIANPGEASLRAALRPAATDYLYFVANDQGGHFFARTLAEHNRNVAKLRRRLNVDAHAAAAASNKEQR